MADNKTEVAKVKSDRNITDNVMQRYNETVAANAIDIPSDYSAKNALKSAWFTLQEVKDTQGNIALNTCTKDSIANALYEMVVDGLNPMKKQCYFIAYGKTLTMQPSYQGNIAMAKRYSGVQSVRAREIYKDDVFTTEILTDGREVLVKHEQPFKNTDGNIIGGYCVIIDSEGKEHLTKMTIGKIKKAWMMGKANGKSKLHTDFDDEAVKRTVINRACKPYINSSNDESIIDEDNIKEPLETITIDSGDVTEPNSENVEPIQEGELVEEKPEQKKDDNPY